MCGLVLEWKMPDSKVKKTLLHRGERTGEGGGGKVLGTLGLVGSKKLQAVLNLWEY